MVDAKERFEVLLKQEENQYKTCDYLETLCRVSQYSRKRKSEPFLDDNTGVITASSTSWANGNGAATADSPMNEKWRDLICEWAYKVVDEFNLNREIVAVAMNHLDRYLAAFPGTVDKNMFHLLSMTCLYLSIKLNECKYLLIPGSTSTMDTILQLSRGLFTLSQMERMEYDVLQRLQWHVHPPTPQLFVKHFLFMFSIEQHAVRDRALYMAELSVMDYFFVSFKPSEVAMAAILNSLDYFRLQAPSQLNVPLNGDVYFEINFSNVQECQVRLAIIHAQSNEEDDDALDGSAHEDANASPGRPSPVSVVDSATMAGTFEESDKDERNE